MNIKRIIPALLLTAMLAAPALARPELAGVVQGNWGDNVYLGSEGRAYELHVDQDTRFMVNGESIPLASVAPGMHVQAYGDIHEISEPKYGGYHSDEFWDNINNR